ncbi:MAG TPA: three-Cys-motif partner protein TcmP [Defluviitoga tunisiensis]|nr:three-Cys-motif partner protein TcmP [Defluviitoga tunisiensis]
MRSKDDLWDITNRRSTKTKLEILDKVFNMWLTVWNNQNWAQNEWYILDLFAGRGEYIDSGKKKDGSPLIFLRNIKEKKDKLRPNLKIKLFLVEKNKANFNYLKTLVDRYKSEHSLDNVNVYFYNADCNAIIDDILKSLNNSVKNPLFVFIDPSGLQIKKTTVEKIVSLKNPKDILFNYILEGVTRTSGVVKKRHFGKNLNTKEITTIKTLKEFIGDDVDVIEADRMKILEDYAETFISQGLRVVGYDIKYPDRNDTIYYLLFFSKKAPITKIVKDIYVRLREKETGPGLFGRKDLERTLFGKECGIESIQRRSLLYKTKVEYGNWTINHITGCKHGCKFPCYAMMMAKKFGWVQDYEDWRIPRIASNALELLDREILKYKDQIDFVHLCFMSDPFMYDFEKKQLVPEVKDLTLKIIERLNKEHIKVTTLTKGVYPDDILDQKRFLPENEYGITLVSLNDKFKEQYEPFSAPYRDRLNSLKTLANAGLNTWVSMEPYPTPELDKTAQNITDILDELRFVKKIIFGKLNYNRLASYKGNLISVWKNNEDFYKEMAGQVINFCQKNGIKYHIKSGTPLSKSNTVNIFKE